MMGLAHAGVMFIPWPAQPFTLPAAVVLMQAVITGTLLHVRGGKRPPLTPRAVGLLVAVATLSVIGLVALGVRRGLPAWPPADAPWVAVPPLVALAWFAHLARRAASEPLPEESSLLLQRAVVAAPPATAAAWCLSMGHPVAAAAFAGTAATCWLLAYLAREVSAMLSAPRAWRG